MYWRKSRSGSQEIIWGDCKTPVVLENDFQHRLQPKCWHCTFLQVTDSVHEKSMFHIKMYTMSSISQSDKIWTRRVDNKGATARDIASPLDIVAEISGHFPAALVATEAKTESFPKPNKKLWRTQYVWGAGVQSCIYCGAPAGRKRNLEGLFMFYLPYHTTTVALLQGFLDHGGTRGSDRAHRRRVVYVPEPNQRKVSIVSTWNQT